MAMTICMMPGCNTTAGCQCQQPFKYGTHGAWECPKCGRVYGPQVYGCGPCNEQAEINRARQGFAGLPLTIGIRG